MLPSPKHPLIHLIILSIGKQTNQPNHGGSSLECLGCLGSPSGFPAIFTARIGMLRWIRHFPLEKGSLT